MERESCVNEVYLVDRQENNGSFAEAQRNKPMLFISRKLVLLLFVRFLHSFLILGMLVKYLNINFRRYSITKSNCGHSLTETFAHLIFYHI